MVYGMANAIRLHHVGMRSSSGKAMKSAAQKAAKRFGTKALHCPTESHDRYYVPLQLAGRSVYLEFQYYYDPAEDTQVIHWDVVCEDPQKFLKWVGWVTGVRPTFWRNEPPNQPQGVVWVGKNRDGLEYGIMARKEEFYPDLIAISK
jgi:hypothetical protein